MLWLIVAVRKLCGPCFSNHPVMDVCLSDVVDREHDAYVQISFNQVPKRRLVNEVSRLLFHSVICQGFSKSHKVMNWPCLWLHSKGATNVSFVVDHVICMNCLSKLLNLHNPDMPFYLDLPKLHLKQLNEFYIQKFKVVSGHALLSIHYSAKFSE